MKRLVIALVSVFFVLATILTVSYAWFINSGFEEPKISGYSYAAYFASGNGTEEKPYTITNKRHLYNLAWLQFLGNWNEVDKTDGKTLTNQYHFQISPTIKEIDMTGYPLPPIGTETYPFVGVFKGNGCVIKNLEVTNNLTDFGSNHPKSSAVNDTTIGDLNIIGMFGIVGNYKTMYNVSSYVPSVQNFYLDNVTISSKATETLIGLLAGYVAESGNITNVGIYRSGFNFSSAVNHLTGNDFVSKFSLIGDYDSENIGWEDKPTSGGTGPGTSADFGGNFDTELYLRRLQAIVLNAKSSTPSPYLPPLDTSNTYPVPKEGYKVPLTVNPDSVPIISSTPVESDIAGTIYEGAKAQEEISSENIGYVIGNQMKVSTKKIEFSEPLIKPSDNNANYVDSSGNTPKQNATTPRQLFLMKSEKTDYAGNTIRALTTEELATLPESISSIVSWPSGEKYTMMRLSQRFSGGVNFSNSNQNDAWAYHGQVYYDGVAYGEDVEPYNSSGIILPNNAIWFKPKNAGKIRLVMYTGSDGNGFKLIKVTRKYATKANPFFYDSSANDNFAASEINSFTFGSEQLGVNTENLPLYLLLYYEYEVSQADITAGNVEYYLTRGDNDGGAYFLYMDIGTNGGGTGGGGDEPPTYSGNLSSIDFVYTTSGSLETVLEDKSNVLLTVKVATVTTTAIYFKRKVENELDQVLYCITSTGYTITNIGSGTATSVTEANWSSQ